MSKKKKKKKPDIDRTPKDYKIKEQCILFIILVLYLVLYIAYVKLFKNIPLKIHSPYYFISYKYDAIYILFIILFFLVIYFSGTYLLKKIKTTKKKYIFRSSVILTIFFAVIIFFQFNMWSFNKDTFSYNTIFQKDKIVYSYDEINSAELEIYHSSGYLRTDYYINYTLYMNDGEKIKFDAYNAYYTDEDKIIEFDKAIADKRSVVENDYDHYLYNSEKLNEYYNSLYNSN